MPDLKINKVTGRAVPVKGDDIDTDRIIPARYLKEITFSKMGDYPFFDERFNQDGSKKDHPFNEDRFQGASILVGNVNFGCGSSREHAPWALLDWGFRVIIAPTFADIFYNNCFNNSILPIRLPQEQVDKLMADANQASTIKVSVEEQTIERPNGEIIRFELDAGLKRRLLEGLDPVGMTLEHEGDISAFENDDRSDRPWAHMAA